MNRTILGAAAVLAVAGTSLGNIQHTINFDTDASGAPIADLTPLTNQYAAWGVTFNNSHYSAGSSSGSGSSASVWASATDLTITSTSVGAGVPPADGNILHSFSGWLNEDGDPNFEINFAAPIDSVQMDLVGLGASAGYSGFVAFNGNLQVGLVRTSLSGGAAQTIALSGVGPITQVVVLPGTFDDWVGVDNIVFEQAPIPAPAGAAVFGIGAVGLARRRRR